MLPLMQAFGWDVSYLAYITVLIMFVGVVLILLTLRGVKANLIPTVAIMFILLSPGAIELITVTPNISHSALPLMLTAFIFWQIVKDAKPTLKRN